jgi:hypothetical protein
MVSSLNAVIVDLEDPTAPSRQLDPSPAAWTWFGVAGNYAWTERSWSQARFTVHDVRDGRQLFAVDFDSAEFPDPR